MNKTAIMNNISRTFYKASFQLKKHSPEILVVAGVVGTVVSTVMACKATTKVSGILEEHTEAVEKIHKCVQNTELAEKYTAEDSKKDLAITYVQTGVKLAKLYGPAVVLGTLSITSIVASNNILRKRNAAIAAAYATVEKSFKEYRGRVVERFGDKVDHELRYNIKAKEIEETVVDENEVETTVKKTVDVAAPNTGSDYSRFFDPSSKYWEDDPEYNLMFLRNEQNYANDRLKARGFLFLNEVYERLGIPPTKAGQIVGWVYDPKDPIGDNFVDFGIYDVHKEANRDFVNGYEPAILLDFNVDGNIWQLM